MIAVPIPAAVHTSAKKRFWQCLWCFWPAVTGWHESDRLLVGSTTVWDVQLICVCLVRVRGMRHEAGLVTGYRMCVGVSHTRRVHAWVTDPDNWALSVVYLAGVEAA